MPYYKVPVTVLLSAVRYVKADDVGEAAEKVEQCDNSVPYITNWPDSDDYEVPDDSQIEEISQEEYEENQED